MKDVIDSVLVVKVGTSTLMKKDADGREGLDRASFDRIGKQVLDLREQNIQTIVVSSGAITAGMVDVGMSTRPDKQAAMPELQRLASIGWRHIQNSWAEALGGVTSGGVLLTKHELNLHAECKELLGVTHTMLRHGDIIIVNENDVIAHDEIAFGDNDTLAAMYAAELGRSDIFGRVGLVVLSDIDGLYQNKDDRSTLIRIVDDIAKCQHLAGGAGSANGTGGMKTKFDAAQIANDAGVTMWIANSQEKDAIQRAVSGEIGTELRCNIVESFLPL